MDRNTAIGLTAGTAFMLALGAGALSTFAPTVPGSHAAMRALTATSGNAPPYSVPVELRRAHADTCKGYNLELEDAAGIQRRIGREAEADRLLSMRQTCQGGAPTAMRSAR